MSTADAAMTADLLRVASQVVEGIQQGVVRRGFPDVRPMHGFAFAWISRAPATTSGLATHLGISKQAAAQLVDLLVGRGYVERTPDPSDGRARLLVLTDRGHACTAAADQAAGEVVDRWRDRLSALELEQLERALHAIAVPGPMRPAW